MNVCVVGLWHLGCVTAACLAANGHTVVGLEFDPDVIGNLQRGRLPIFEPGLDDLVRRGLDSGTLRFSTDPAVVAQADVVWIAYDTPVDEDDRADVEFVVERVARLFSHLKADTLVLISSQVPVGTTRRLEGDYASRYPGKPIRFGYSPENLRLGKAIQVFTNPDRVVVGLRSEWDRTRVQDLLGPFANRIEWMSIESAEMTKHALNAFLATSVAFANEIAVLCEAVGADAKEVERGLKSEARIGPKAYLGPGAAFAGGTLARDIQFLSEIGAVNRVPVNLLASVKVSNDAHKDWAKRKLVEILGNLAGKTIAVWGLTYKPGTDTLRRSSSVELCMWLAGHGANVQTHDPAVKTLPSELSTHISLVTEPLSALANAAVLVVATEWPDYRAIEANAVCQAMAAPVVIDASRFLGQTLGQDTRIRYLTVGKS